MKNRNIPYGYCYENGKVIIKKFEVEILKQIFEQYLQGLSLLDIAKNLNEKEIEYAPGVIGWNKSRLSRIIDDKRYLGNNFFPAIVDQTIFDKMHELKEMKNTQKKTDRQSPIFRMEVPVRCSSCGKIMRRRYDSRTQEHCRWVCTNSNCKSIIGIADEVFLQQVIDKLNMAINNPDIIEIPEESKTQNDVIFKMNLEIENSLESGQFDKTRLRKKIMECAAKKYMEIDNAYYIASRLKADLEEASPLSTFSIDFYHQTVESIWLRSNKTLSLVLVNGQKI